MTFLYSPKQCKPVFNHFFFLVFLFYFIRSSEINSDAKRRSKSDFDILIFTQRWPITDCMTWMNRGSDHVCLLPSQRDVWLIHGVWPTKYGTIGPGFCNSSAPFDLDSLDPLIDQMRQYWLNIEKGNCNLKKRIQKIDDNIVLIGKHFQFKQEPRRHHYGSMNGKSMAHALVSSQNYKRRINISAKVWHGFNSTP